MIRRTDAIQSLRPDAEWIMRGDVLEWLDTKQSKPTEAQIATELARLESEYVTNEYQRQRAVEYPSIPDQLDTLYHSGLDAWKAQIKTVKDKYPKV
jgi:hypothetical protein